MNIISDFLQFKTLQVKLGSTKIRTANLTGLLYRILNNKQKLNTTSQKINKFLQCVLYQYH